MIKQRSIPISIVLCFVTCGLYSLYWWACVNDETNRIVGKDDVSGIMVVVFSILTCGIYGFYWAYKIGEKVDQIRSNRGQAPNSLHIIFLVLSLIGFQIVNIALIQNEINQTVGNGAM